MRGVFSLTAIVFRRAQSLTRLSGQNESRSQHIFHFHPRDDPHRPRCRSQQNKGRRQPRRARLSLSRAQRNSLRNSSSMPPIRMSHPARPPTKRHPTMITSRILFQRGVYPSDDFQMVKKYGQTVLITQDAALEAYLDKFVFSLPVSPIVIYQQ